jgi:phospholipase C
MHMWRSTRRFRFAGLFVAILLAVTAGGVLSGRGAPPAVAAGSPIQHIVILDLENHSFDNLLGFWCQTSPRCGPGDAMPAAVTLSNGAVVTPAGEPDVFPMLNHNVASQVAAINNGAMDGWGNIPQGPGGPACNAAHNYQCIAGYQPTQVPNIITLASTWAMNDRFFSLKNSPSWGGHLYAVAATTDGFSGDNPLPAKGVTTGPGWGCDSNRLATRIYGPPMPSCVPDFGLGIPNGGAFEPTSALHVPTIMDELDAAGLSWHIYGAASPGQGGYQWDVCPSFAGCSHTGQEGDSVDQSEFFTDAAAGSLPAWSLITAGGASKAAQKATCHNGMSMVACDNYVGQVATAVMNSPQWSSTVLLITWDDFGGAYDSAAPPVAPDGTQEGIRLPLIAVSPFAIPASTDSTPASFASILALTEHVFGLAPLEANDLGAYDLSGMFTMGAARRHVVKPRMVVRPVPRGDRLIWSQEDEGT